MREIINLFYRLNSYILTFQKFRDLSSQLQDEITLCCGSFHSGILYGRESHSHEKHENRTAQAPYERTCEQPTSKLVFKQSSELVSRMATSCVLACPRISSSGWQSHDEIIISQVADGNDCEIIAQHWWSYG